MSSPSDIARRILVVRGQRVLLAAELARLYGVETRALAQAVRRNAARFPADFVFRLTNQELANLKSQFVISSREGRRAAPLAFTEHGAIMAASVLRSDLAMDVSVMVVRAFVQMRDVLQANKELARRLDELERRVGTQDGAIAQILGAIRQLTQTTDSPPKRRRIGFV